VLFDFWIAPVNMYVKCSSSVRRQSHLMWIYLTLAWTVIQRFTCSQYVVSEL